MRRSPSTQLAIDLARRTDNPRREAWALGLGGWAHLLAGDLDAARRWTDECLAITAATRWIAFRPWPLAVLAELRLADGVPPQRLRDELDESFALSCSLADPCWEGATARVIAMAHATSGELDEALEWIDQAQRRCRRETDVFVAVQATILATDAELSRRADDPSRADASARALVALAARTHMDAHLARGLELMGATPS